jgi:hypothetical protein
VPTPPDSPTLFTSKSSPSQKYLSSHIHRRVSSGRGSNQSPRRPHRAPLPEPHERRTPSSARSIGPMVTRFVPWQAIFFEGVLPPKNPLPPPATSSRTAALTSPMAIRYRTTAPCSTIAVFQPESRPLRFPNPGDTPTIFLGPFAANGPCTLGVSD